MTIFNPHRTPRRPQHSILNTEWHVQKQKDKKGFTTTTNTLRLSREYVDKLFYFQLQERWYKRLEIRNYIELTREFVLWLLQSTYNKDMYCFACGFTVTSITSCAPLTVHSPINLTTNPLNHRTPFAPKLFVDGFGWRGPRPACVRWCMCVCVCIMVHRTQRRNLNLSGPVERAPL